jgi:hypothetical protein
MNSSPDYDDDDCHSVQLEGSDMAPRAAKVSLIYLFQNMYQTDFMLHMYRQSYNRDSP